MLESESNQQLLDKLNSLLEFKQSLEQALSVYDEVHSIIQDTKLFEIAEAFVILVLFVITYSTPFFLLVFASSVVLHIFFISFLEFRNLKRCNVPQSLRNVHEGYLANVCTQKYLRFIQACPKLLQFTVSQTKSYCLILSTEIDKKLSELDAKHISPLKLALTQHSDQPIEQTLNEILKQNSFSVDDSKFLRTVLLYEIDLAKIFDFQSESKLCKF